MLKLGGLGKGLDLIFMENNPENENAPMVLNISELEANSKQPRMNFKDSSLRELANSITLHGLIQPIVVKPMTSGKYKIIAGERRYRASKLAGLTEVPVIIKDVDDSKIMELALVENLQREDLSCIEEARGYKSLIDAYNFTQEDVSKTVGKSRSYVANTIRLLNLPDEVIEKLENFEITAGHARALLALNNRDNIEDVLQVTLLQNLNVRQLEQLVNRVNSSQVEESKIEKVAHKDDVFHAIEDNLAKILERKVKIVCNKKKKGTIQISFADEDDLSRICKMLEDIK